MLWKKKHTHEKSLINIEIIKWLNEKEIIIFECMCESIEMKWKKIIVEHDAMTSLRAI